ncbi:hypothetical protein GOV06_05270 [Candidatus Woesearchaeota archaeon]|nr:hypothetical protein [Candidatus Woesearchaeota archaeon]
MGKKIKRERAVIYLLLIAVVVSALTYLVYTNLKPAAIRTIDMHLTVGNYTGFDINTSALIFGTVIPSSYAKRIINITNIDEDIHNVYIEPTGELAEWTSISETEFILIKDESKEIEIIIYAPSDAEHGKHTGRLKIIFR